MSLVQTVSVLGLVYNANDAWDFALSNGVTEKQLQAAGTCDALNALFERKGFNTRCITMLPTQRRPLSFCIVTDFAVIPRRYTGQRMPKMQCTEWTKRVCHALLSRDEYVNFLGRMRQLVVKGDDIPPYVHYLFQMQLSGKPIISLSPDQTDYSLFKEERAKLRAQIMAKRTNAAPKPKTHTRRYLKEVADPLPTSPSPTNIRPPRPTKRARKTKKPKKSNGDSSDSDADIEFGYESDAGYYSDVTICATVRHD